MKTRWNRRSILIVCRMAILGCVVLLVCAPIAATGKQNPALSALCYRAIDAVSERTGVPRNVMLAISLTETGRKMQGEMRPWPWTVNMEGKGEWFDTRDAALAYVKRHFARGARSFDVGCFQINYKWHHQHFSSIEAMFDPMINTTYAARFLSELYAEKGSWPAAAGAYHSRTPKYANRYAKRFTRYVARLGGDTSSPVFAGNGSENLQMVDASLPTGIQQEPQRWQPLFDLSPLTRTKSPTPATRGSLFQNAPSSQSLLRPARGSLY